MESKHIKIMPESKLLTTGHGLTEDEWKQFRAKLILNDLTVARWVRGRIREYTKGEKS